VTEKVVDINPGADDEIEDVVLVGQTIFLNIRDRALDGDGKYYRSIVTVTNGEIHRTNASVAVYSGPDESSLEKTGNYLRISGTGTEVFAQKYSYQDGSYRVETLLWQGSAFQPLSGLVGSSIDLIGSIGSTTFFHVVTSQGAAPSLRSVKSGSVSTLDLSAMGFIAPGSYLSVTGSRPGNAWVSLNSGEDSIPKLFRLEPKAD
jgi:hypothetical protein